MARISHWRDVVIYSYDSRLSRIRIKCEARVSSPYEEGKRSLAEIPPSQTLSLEEHIRTATLRSYRGLIFILGMTPTKCNSDNRTIFLVSKDPIIRL